VSDAQPPDVEGLDLRLEGGCARVVMKRHDAGNSLTLESAAELLAAVRWVNAVGARVLVIESSARAWCVGGDIRAFDGAADRAIYIDDLAEALHRLISELTRSDAIVVAAVDGAAAGAGMPLATAADVVLASDRARFTLGYTRIGLTPDGGTSLLATTVGLHRMLQLALLNPVLSAAEAQEIGLVARVVAPEALAASVDDVVATLLAGPPDALAATKRLLRTQVAADAEAALRRETLTLRRAAASAESAEGLAAFLAKRPPNFSNHS
jgi:2-(1,2-epoxy-1,2-dihydrophenyl)acetyl-CoA isomerase